MIKPRRQRQAIIRGLLDDLIARIETMDDDELAEIGDRFDLDELGIDQDDLVEEERWP